MRKRTTIFRQLAFTVITPVVFIIVALGFYNFFQERKEIHQDRLNHMNQVKIEVRDFIDFFDQTVLEFETQMSTIARKLSDTLVNQIFVETKNIETVDLDSLRNVLGMTQTQDLYIVNTKGVIVNTTFEKDLGLCFFDFGDYFVDHFNTCFASGDFVEDRISIEAATKAPKKYTYQATLDKKYVIEIGLYDEHSRNIVQLFTDKLNTISEKYSDIDTISLFFGTDKFINYQGHGLTKGEQKLALETLKNKKEAVHVEIRDGIKHFTQFLFLDINDSHLNEGYIVRMKYNNSSENVLIKAQLASFGILMGLFLIPIILIIFWRARVISKPISVLNNKVAEIQNGNLNIRVPIKGRNEVTALSEHFNSMLVQLKESYDTLEDKVQQRTEELVHKNQLIEESHKEIQDSINYSKRLQQAILPTMETIQNHLPECFVYFKPKDIVSGDFYWFEHHNDFDFIAAADCTGHGVPGAMVSFLCNNALNRSLFEFSKISPENVLNNTREIIIDTFSKSHENIKDGMDISLLRIDKKKKEVMFVGANNPLWIVRKADLLSDDIKEKYKVFIQDELALIEVKGDKQPVGLHEHMEPFKCHRIEILERDTFYLFTDGFADQFGGARAKKFMYKPFKKFLISISQLSMKEQQAEIHKTFQEWKGNCEQVDDVCVIGVSV